uniref:Mut7-C RNAse domain-containing protein n=1 Tax=Pyrodinium bahamense TaxID=73915 RepID=A0A7S0AK95_9DINO
MNGLVYLLRGTAADEQLREVCVVFGIDGRRRADFAMDRRCCVCNGLLMTIGREAVRGRVPTRAVESYDAFFTCERDPCKTIFWHSSSYLEGKHEIQRSLEDLCF